MRAFVLWTRAVTTSNFNLKDLPSSGRRMDLVARCIIASLWLSHKLREDTRIYVVLNGPPEPPKTVLFDSSINRISPDERSIAIWIKKALEYAERKGVQKEWISLENNIKISTKSFQDVIRELKEEGCNFYVLHERGKFIEEVELKENPVFVLGDHEGIPKNEEAFVLRYGKRVSLGKQKYIASNCIAIVNWICDLRGIL
jgi:tRNA (pseudouridine54-N1)-methyltransferase